MRPVRSRLIRGCTAGLCLFLMGGLVPVAATADPTASPSAGNYSPAPTAVSSTSYSLTPSDFSLLVSPARLAIGVQDIDSAHQMTVVNRGQTALSLVVQKRNFRPGLDGSLQFDPDAPWAAAKWVTATPARFDLQPGATQMVSVTIDPPEQPEAGDHQVALVVLAPTTGSAANIRLNRGIAQPIYITMDGGPLDDTVQLRGLTGPGLSLFGKATLTATLENTGNVHRDFRGPTALAVGSAGHSTPFGDFTVPRGATRVVDTQWQPPFVCVCHPRVSFRNDSGGEQVASIRMVVFPWWLAVAVLVAMVVGATLFARSRRRTTGGPAGATGPEAAAAGSGDG